MLIVSELKDTERNIPRPFLFRIVLMTKERPTAIGDPKQQRARMAGVAERKPSARRKERRYDRSRKSTLLGERGELLVEDTYEFFLVQPIHEAAHQ